MDNGHLLAIRTVGILTAFQHAGITAFETKREDVEGYVRASLVDHSDDTERYAHTTETKSVRQRLLLGDMAKWRG